jgi:prevent-host-death family protein
MVMDESSYTATRLKAELLRVLDTVESSGEPVTVTKHGRPVARLVPMDDHAPLRGSVTFNVSDDDLLLPVDERWDADSA